MTRVAKRDAIRAIKLGDGSFLVRSGCCRPAKCAPAADARCCFSTRCACEWPAVIGYTLPVATLPEEPRTERRFRAGMAAVVVVGVSAGVGLCAGLAWMVYTAVTAAATWVASSWPLLLGVALVLAVVGRPVHRACTTIVKVTHKH